jgi:hypothetical protein
MSSKRYPDATIARKGVRQEMTAHPGVDRCDSCHRQIGRDQAVMLGVTVIEGPEKDVYEDASCLGRVCLACYLIELLT